MKAWISQCKDRLARKYRRFVRELSWLCGKPVLYSGKARYGNSNAVHELYTCLSSDDDGYLVYRLKEDNKLVRFDLTEDYMILGHSNKARFTVEDSSVDAEHAAFVRRKGEDGHYCYYVRNVSPNYPVYITDCQGKLLKKLPAVPEQPFPAPDALPHDGTNPGSQTSTDAVISGNALADKPAPGYELHSGNMIVMSGLMVLFLRRSATDELSVSFASMSAPHFGSPFSHPPESKAQSPAVSLLQTAQSAAQSLLDTASSLPAAQMEPLPVKNENFP